VGDESCDVWLFQVRTKALAFHNKHHNECWLSSVAWAPDGATFLFGCRPNAHAGRPTLWEPVVRAEAARSDEAREVRTRLVAAIDAEIAKAPGEARRRLEAWRGSVERTERAGDLGKTPSGGYVAFAPDATIDEYYVLGGPVNLNSANSVGWTYGEPAAPPAPPADAPVELQSLAKEHEEALQKGMKKLKRSFRVNAWSTK